MKDYEATGASRAHNVAFPRYMLHVTHKKLSNYNKLLHYAILWARIKAPIVYTCQLLEIYCIHIPHLFYLADLLQKAHFREIGVHMRNLNFLCGKSETR